MILGTVGYMSPEQVRGLPADHRSDIFSFGAILYEMVTGDQAFRRSSAVETLSAILKEEPSELSQGSAKVPPDLARILGHCLEKDPAERFQSARDIAFDLETLARASGREPAATAGCARADVADLLASDRARRVGDARDRVCPRERSAGQMLQRPRSPSIV